MIRQQYNDIASLYDMLAEGDDGMIWFRQNLKETLQGLQSGARVLDCSCGTGNHAIWLAKQGFKVHASDISEGMLETAKIKAEKEGVDIHFFRSSWTDLHSHTKHKYELVIAPGNSLSHLLDLSMMDDIFSSIRKILEPGASFFFDIRNWGKTYEESSLETQDFKAKGGDGLYEVRYSYKMPSWNEIGQMHVDIRPDGTEKYKRYSFNFLPVGYQQIVESASRAGFTEIERGFFPGEDYYFILAR